MYLRDNILPYIKGTESVSKKKKKPWDFLSGPVVKILHFQYKGYKFNYWLGNKFPYASKSNKKSPGFPTDASPTKSSNQWLLSRTTVESGVNSFPVSLMNLITSFLPCPNSIGQSSSPYSI